MLFFVMDIAFLICMCKTEVNKWQLVFGVPGLARARWAQRAVGPARSGTTAIGSCLGLMYSSWAGTARHEVPGMPCRPDRLGPCRAGHMAIFTPHSVIVCSMVYQPLKNLILELILRFIYCSLFFTFTL